MKPHQRLWIAIGVTIYIILSYYAWIFVIDKQDTSALLAMFFLQNLVGAIYAAALPSKDIFYLLIPIGWIVLIIQSFNKNYDKMIEWLVKKGII